MNDWMNDGWQPVDEESQRREEMESRVFLPFFKLKAGEETRIRFLHPEPVNIYEHFVQAMRRTFTCTRDENCPLCAIGNKARFQGCFLIIDFTHEKWVDEESGQQKERQYTLKLMKHSLSNLKIIKSRHEKYGLLEYDWDIERTGKGVNTRYSLDPVDREEIPMPEKDEIPDIKEVIKPPDRDWLLQRMREKGMGQPTQKPLDVSEEDEGVLEFE